MIFQCQSVFGYELFRAYWFSGARDDFEEPVSPLYSPPVVEPRSRRKDSSQRLEKFNNGTTESLSRSRIRNEDARRQVESGSKDVASSELRTLEPRNSISSKGNSKSFVEETISPSSAVELTTQASIGPKVSSNSKKLLDATSIFSEESNLSSLSAQSAPAKNEKSDEFSAKPNSSKESVILKCE